METCEREFIDPERFRNSQGKITAAYLMAEAARVIGGLSFGALNDRNKGELPGLEDILGNVFQLHVKELPSEYTVRELIRYGVRRGMIQYNELEQSIRIELPD